MTSLKHDRYLIAVIRIWLVVSVYSFIHLPSFAVSEKWTQKRLNQAIYSMHKAAYRQNWETAIEHGENMVQGIIALSKKTQPRYIHQLKNLNTYYNKAGKLKEVSTRVAETYQLSKEHIGAHHPTTSTSRRLYYNLLLLLEDYQKALFVAEEIYQNLQKANICKQVHYLQQISSLSGLVENWEKQEDSLEKYLQIYTPSCEVPQSKKAIIKQLATSYCRQLKLTLFAQLQKQHNLKLICVP